MKKNKNYVNTKYARKRGGYLDVLNKIRSKGICPFCPDNFRWHKKPILFSTRNWVITKATWPYKNSNYHFLIIGKKHKENFNEISDLDFKEISVLSKKTILKNRIKGGGLALRFGDEKYTGATVKHIHLHLIVPKKGKVVTFPFG